MVKVFTTLLFLFPNFLFAGVTNDDFWKPIKYGWVCPASMDLTEETIYSNTNKTQISATDMIEPILGLYERHLATQYGSNLYYVSPLNLVETFFDLIYTNGTIVTNSIMKTNAIGYYPNLTPFLGGAGFWVPCPFDEALTYTISYLLETNSIFDGTTNMAADAYTNILTRLNIPWKKEGDVSGEWPGLRIVPALGTSVFTNYWIRYTQDVSALADAGVETTNYSEGGTTWIYHSYIYTTNRLTNVQDYLAPYSQQVNYSVSVRESQRYIYTSYWVSATQHYEASTLKLIYDYTNAWMGVPYVVHFTNYPWYSETRIRYGWGYYMAVALGLGTYWDYGYDYDYWEGFELYDYGYNRYTIYQEVLRDRCKILSALKYTVPSFSYTGFSKTVSMSSNNTDLAGLSALKSLAEATFATTAVAAAGSTPLAYASVARNGTAPNQLNWTVSLTRGYGVWKTGYVTTNVVHAQPQAYLRGRTSSTNWVFNGQSDNISSTDAYTLAYYSQESSATNYYTFVIGDSGLSAPSWPAVPSVNGTYTKGYLTDATDRKVVVPWNFTYCTNTIN